MEMLITYTGYVHYMCNIYDISNVYARAICVVVSQQTHFLHRRTGFIIWIQNTFQCVYVVHQGPQELGVCLPCSSNTQEQVS